MRRHLTLPLALLLIALGVPSNAQNEPEPAAAPSAGAAPEPTAAAGPVTVVYYDVGRTYALNCSAPRSGDAGAYVWKKNDSAVESWGDLRDRYKLEEGGAVFRMAVRTQEDDFGNYSCAFGTGAPAHQWELRGRPFAKLPHNTNVVEKQTLKLTCKLIGKPHPAVSWTFSNSSDGANGSDVQAVLGERVKLQRSEQGVDNAELVLTDAQRSDAGVYTCTPQGGLAASTTLRVKDQYAALWPFLGICAEVFVLCAIILVYEKRRTKPELDDSDTDNHDQKKS